MNDSQTQKLLIIGSVWPEPESSAAGQRMMQLIDCFHSAGWDIAFASSAAKGRYSVDFSARNIQSFPIKINDPAVDEFLAEIKPDAVLFDRFITEEQFGWRVAEQCPDALRILDTEDLHFLRRARKKALNEGRSCTDEDLLREETAKREIASIFRSDLSLIISGYEYQLLRNPFRVDEALLIETPFMMDPIDDKKIQAWPAYEERRHFVTIGNFRHAPNWDAVQYLEQSIWPLIHEELPEADLHIYGAYPSKKAKALHQPERGFFIEGRVENAKKVVRQARVCLAPLRFGAGLKGKLTEAMQCGTPSVTTPIGAEGMVGDMKWSGIIAEGPENLARAAIKMYSEKSLWEKARQQGVKIINRRFDKNRIGTDLIGRVEEIRRNIEKHRLQNFTGAMLLYHTTASTKYMAKWIEAKNAG